MSEKYIPLRETFRAPEPSDKRVGLDKRGNEKWREREKSSMERVRNLGSMLTKNIKGLCILGPRGRKIGKGLLLAYTFGLVAEVGAVWQAKNIHQANIEHQLKYGKMKSGSVGDRFLRGEITRDEAIDQLAQQGTHLGFKTEGMRMGEGPSGLAGVETLVAGQLNEIGLKLAEMSARRGGSPEVSEDALISFSRTVDEDINKSAGNTVDKMVQRTQK